MVKIGEVLVQKGMITQQQLDAAIAVHFALSVVYPSAGNLGGGGFAVYRLNNGKVGTLDFREKAPINSSKNMYLNNENEIRFSEGTSNGTNYITLKAPASVAINAMEYSPKLIIIYNSTKIQEQPLP